MEKLIIRKVPGGWQVVQFKEFGLNKGETVLATTCGGNLGTILAHSVLKTAAQMTGITNVEIEDRDNG